jgi:DNA-binding transcriptional LysR family regulator
MHPAHGVIGHVTGVRGTTLQPEGDRSMERMRKLENAPLDVGVMSTIGTGRLIALLAQVRRDHPGIRLTLREEAPSKVMDSLLEGRVGCGFVGTPIEVPERCQARPLFRERYVVAFPPGHRFEAMNAVRLADLDGEPYVWRRDCEYTNRFVELFAASGFTWNMVYSSEREEWVQRMVLAGLGCALMPEHLVLFPGLPTRVLIEPEVTREVMLVTVGGRRFSAALDTFVRLASRFDWAGA